MNVIKKVLERPNRVACIGDMRERVKLHIREIVAPVFEGVDFTEKFSGIKEVWANVKTVSGQTIFIINIDVSITHEIIIRYDADVDSETWIEHNKNNFKILDVEDLDERHEFLRLKCAKRGDKDLGAAQA